MPARYRDGLAGEGIGKLLLTSMRPVPLRPEMAPGSVMVITDHNQFHPAQLRFSASPTDRRFGWHTEAYDPELRAGLRSAARNQGTALHEGNLHVDFSGPSFEERPAEIRNGGVCWAPMRSACPPCRR